MVPFGYELSLYGHGSFLLKKTTVVGKPFQANEEMECYNLTGLPINDDTSSLEIRKIVYSARGDWIQRTGSSEDINYAVT